MIRTLAYYRFIINTNKIKRNFVTLHDQADSIIVKPEMRKFLENTTDEGYYWKSYLGNIPNSNYMVHEHVWQNLSKWQDKIAIICGITKRSYTYGKLRDKCAIFASHLQQTFKLNTNDVIAICLPNLPEYPIVTLGAFEAGITISPINPAYTIDEMSKQLLQIKPKLLITTIENYTKLKIYYETTLKQQKIIVIKTTSSDALPINAINFFDLIEFNAGCIKINRQSDDLDNTCFIPFSSGTTGSPKGVMITHKNITTNIEIYNTKLGSDRIVHETTDSHQDVLPICLPLFHLYANVIGLLSNLTLGCKMITTPTFNYHNFINIITESKSTLLQLVPSIISRINNDPVITSKHLESVRVILSGAAALSITDVRRLNEKSPNTILLQAYGQTECCGITTLNTLYSNNYMTVGYPAPSTELKITSIATTDDNLNTLLTNKGIAPHQKGEILIRGSHIMKGYLNNEKATNSTITENGWLRTGDIGYYDENGLIYMTDRLKELIKVKGYQVSPAEIESILREHPSVLDVGVIGVPHEYKGEVPRAFIVRDLNASVSENELIQYVAKKLTNYKHLAGGVQFIDQIPRNPSGKILRRMIKDLYC